MRIIPTLSVCTFLFAFLFVVSSQEETYNGEVAWSPTNELLVSAPSGLYLYSAGTIQTLSTYPTNHPAFSPDGTLLAYAVVSDETLSVVVQRTHESQPLFTFAVEADLVSAISFNADSSLLAVTVNRFIPGDFRNINSTEVWDIETQQRLNVLDFGIPNGGALTWGDSTDTVWMLGGDYDGVFVFANAVNARTGEQVVNIREYLMFFTPGKAAINNHWVAFWTAVDAPDIPGFTIYPLDETVFAPQPYRKFEFYEPFAGTTITEVGDRMAFQTSIDKTFAIMDVEQGRVIYTGQASESIIDGLLFSPDGSQLAITTYSPSRHAQDVEIWDAELMVRLDTISVSSAVAQQPPPSLFPNAGSDATYYDLNNDGSTLVQLDASASTGEISSYAWTVAGNPLATGTAPLVSLPLGFHEISLAVSNAQGQSATDSVGITVAAAPAGYQALRLQHVCMQADRSADIWRVTNPNAVPVMFWYGRTSTERLGTREVPGAGNLELLVPRATGSGSGGGLLGGFFCSVPLQISVDTVAQALGAVSCSPGFTVQPPVCPQ